MRAAELVRLVRIERRVNAAEDHPGAALPRDPPHLMAAQRIGGVDADADDVAGLDGLGYNGFQRLVNDQRIAILRGVAAASTYSHRGVITPIPNATSLGLTKCTRINPHFMPSEASASLDPGVRSKTRTAVPV